MVNTFLIQFRSIKLFYQSFTNVIKVHIEYI